MTGCPASPEGPALRVRVRGTAPFRLSRRSPTLGGNVPLRAAQSCPPFLLGNAFGWQLSPPRPMRLRRGLRAITGDPPLLSARAISSEVVEVRIDSGLTVEPAAGVVLAVERAYNRRDRRVDVVEQELAAPADLHLVLRVRLSRGDGELTLDGELASLAPFAAAPPWPLLPLRAGRAVAADHLAFFDEAYFAGKRGAATRKYRRAASPSRAGAGGPCFVHGGGAVPRLERSAAGVLSARLPLELAARLRYHGQRPEALLPERPLRARADEIARTWGEVFGDAVSADSGALRYLTTYVTTHTAGDPHLFFKPATLVRTPPGWCAVLDGPAADGWEVLRGVTEAAWFPALPAVIALHQAEVSLRAGTPLLRVRPVPRALVDADLAWA